LDRFVAPPDFENVRIMRCLNCGFENAAGSRFCIECGAMVSKQCPGCGFANLLAAKFCAQCAAPLGAAASTQAAVPVRAEPAQPEIPLDAERRTITALFADIKSSTELMRDLDPEEARANWSGSWSTRARAIRSLSKK
jgi:hypothetical protein